jgi:hypothetical protein
MASRFPCSYNVDMVKGYTRTKTTDQAHVYKIGNLYEISGGVRLEVYELDETIVIDRKDAIPGFCVERRGGVFSLSLSLAPQSQG